MEAQPQGHLADVLPIHQPNGVERVNGIKMHIGAMSLGVLQQLEGYTRERIAEAQHDLLIIQYYEEKLSPAPGAA